MKDLEKRGGKYSGQRRNWKTLKDGGIVDYPFSSGVGEHIYETIRGKGFEYIDGPARLWKKNT